MDEAAVQAAVAKALEPVKLEFTSKLTKLETDHAAAMAKKDQELKDQAIKFKRDQIDAVFNAAIESKDIVPAVRNEFEALTGIGKDPNRVVDVDIATVQKFIKDHPNPEKSKGSMATRSGSGNSISGTSSQVLQFKARERVVANGGKASNFEDMHFATKQILESDQSLATAYFNDPNAAYQEA